MQRYAKFWFFKKRSGNIFSNISCLWFFQKNVFPNFIVWLPLPLEILGIMCIAIVCFPGCDVIKFEINLISWNKSFFCMTKNSVSWEQKELLRWNKMYFSSFLKGFQLRKIVSDWECISESHLCKWRNP